MIALELIDKIFLTSICVVALFGVIGAPLLFTDNEKMKIFCLSGMILGTISSIVILLLKVWVY